MAHSIDLSRHLPPWLALLRPHQWVKNLFILLPLFFTPSVVTQANFFLLLAGVAIFCTVSSAIYIMNDYADRQEDRLHPIKKKRPLAAKTVSVKQAGMLLAALILGAVGGTFLIPNTCWWVFPATYFGLNIAYSFYLKHIALLDVVIVSLGFILRVMAGAYLVGIDASLWIIVCTGFLSLFMAFGKRRDDVIRGSKRKSVNSYNEAFVNSAMTILATLSILCYTFYTMDPAVQAHFGTDKLYVTIPFVLLGFLRYLQLCLVAEKGGSPTSVVLTDRFLKVVVLLWLLTFGWLIYV